MKVGRESSAQTASLTRAEPTLQNPKPPCSIVERELGSDSQNPDGRAVLPLSDAEPSEAATRTLIADLVDLAAREDRLAAGVQGPAFRGSEWGADIIEAHRARAKTLRLAADEIAKLRATVANPPKHRFWRPGEPDCPEDVKGANGELHTLRCKNCGRDDPLDDICRAMVAQ